MRLSIERAKQIAERNKDKDKREFFLHLQECGWENDEVAIMWMYAQKMKGENV